MCSRFFHYFCTQTCVLKHQSLELWLMIPLIIILVALYKEASCYILCIQIASLCLWCCSNTLFKAVDTDQKIAFVSHKQYHWTLEQLITHMYQFTTKSQDEQYPTPFCFCPDCHSRSFVSSSFKYSIIYIYIRKH